MILYNFFHQTCGSTKYNKINKVNEHKILRKNVVNTRLYEWFCTWYGTRKLFPMSIVRAMPQVRERAKLPSHHTHTP